MYIYRPLGFISTHALRIWGLMLLITLALSAIAFRYYDVPVMKHCVGGLASWLHSLTNGLSGHTLMTGEFLIILLILLSRQKSGKIRRFSDTLLTADIASACAYLLNALVLKKLFGVPNTWAVLTGTPHHFNFLMGSAQSVFPSGHMMLAGGFAGVFMYVYPKTRRGLSLLLLIGMSLLVYSCWHFISDVLVGTFLGLTIGLLAAALLSQHGKTRIRGTEAILTSVHEENFRKSPLEKN